jgi:hypothetical protein
MGNSGVSSLWLAPGGDDELEDHQAHQEEQVNPQADQAELDEGGHLDFRLGVLSIDFADLGHEALDNRIHDGTPFSAEGRL